MNKLLTGLTISALSFLTLYFSFSPYSSVDYIVDLNYDKQTGPKQPAPEKPAKEEVIYPKNDHVQVLEPKAFFELHGIGKSLKHPKHQKLYLIFYKDIYDIIPDYGAISYDMDAYRQIYVYTAFLKDFEGRRGPVNNVLIFTVFDAETGEAKSGGHRNLNKR